MNTAIDTITLEVADPTAAERFYTAAFGLDAQLRLRASQDPTTAKSIWGYGGVVKAPDGTIWKVATQAKKDTGPATGRVDGTVLLLGVADVAASKRFYVDHGLTVARSFDRMYVEFTPGPTGITLALYRRRALAKVAGVSPDGTGSHRIAVGGATEPFTDPDGFAWETSSMATLS